MELHRFISGNSNYFSLIFNLDSVVLILSPDVSVGSVGNCGWGFSVQRIAELCFLFPPESRGSAAQLLEAGLGHCANLNLILMELKFHIVSERFQHSCIMYTSKRHLIEYDTRQVIYFWYVFFRKSKALNQIHWKYKINKFRKEVWQPRGHPEKDYYSIWINLHILIFFDIVYEVGRWWK